MFYYFSGSERDIELTISDVYIYYAEYGAIYATNYNGSLDLTLEGVITNYTWQPLITGAWDPNSTGRLDLTITDCAFIDFYYYMDIEADVVGDIEISGTNFDGVYYSGALYIYDNYGDMSLVIDGAVFEDIYGDAIYVYSDALVDFQVTNSVFTNIGGYGIELYSDDKDMNFVMNNVTMVNVDNGGFYVTTYNGSIDASMTDVHTDNIWWIGGWYASSIDGIARVDFSIADSSFNNSVYGVWYEEEVCGDIVVTNTEFTGVWNWAALQLSPYITTPSGDLSMVLEDVLMDDVYYGIDPQVNGNITLSMESVVINNTNELGWFTASNVDGTAVIDVMINNCSFSNATYGFEFIADTVGDYSMTNTVFNNIEYYAVSMTFDHADMLVPIENVQSTNVGSFLDLHITFGNIELVMADSLLSGNNDSGIFLVDLSVNSNTLTNGFITLTVTNSTLMNAGGGIRTWSEKLNPLGMTTTVFENIIGECMHFDVRSGDQTFTFVDDDVTVINSGTGLWVYANDGDINLNFTGVNFNTNEFGVFVEVSSLDLDNMTMINMEIIDSVFEGGAYGVYAMSLNGGTVLIDGSQFLGHSEAGYWFDSLFGEMDVTITDSVFDGSVAADETVYMVEEVENTFQLIGRNYWEMGVDAWNSGGVWIDLPFAFNYNGVEYTSVYLHEDGSLGFAMGEEILPVGDTNLIYNYEQFFGYKVAADNMSVMFHWYASEAFSGYGTSLAFQVVLFADGTIQFNYADMEAYSSDVPYGLLTDNSMIYDLNSLYNVPKWEADWMAYLFTPLPISYGMGVLLTMEEGNLSAVITNNTVTGYYKGGVAVLSLDGNLGLEVTGNDFSKIVGDEFASLHIYDFNGASEVVMSNNSFERIWGLAIYLYLSSTEGGEKIVDMSDSVFNKVGYVLYSIIEVYDDTGRTGNDTLDVTVNFQNNVMTDAYGLVCWIDMYLYDPVDWTVTVNQTMTDNVMIQENYMGSWPFPAMYPTSSALGSAVYIEQYGEDENSVTLEQTATVTDNYIECPGPVGIDVGNVIYNYYGDTIRNAVIDVSDNLLNISGSYGIDVWSDMYTGFGNVADDSSITVENNEINDGAQSISGIIVYASVESYTGISLDQSGDADVTTYVSVCDNLVEGAYLGIYSEIWFYQNNVIGDWNVSLTSHMDRNHLLNVSYAIESYLYAGPYFSGNYWPPENETAVANFVMDYLYTVDDNVVVCPYNMDFNGEMIYVEIEYWAWIETGTLSLAAESYAWITGTVSISGNDLTQIDGDLSGISLYHWLGAQKNSWIWVDVDVAIEDNVLLVTWENDGPGPRPPAAITVENEMEVRSNDYAITPVGATVDMSWSITGNEVNSGFRYGVEVLENIYVVDGMSSTDYAITWDISGNTLTDVKEYGIYYELYRNEETSGAIEMNVAVDIMNNIISLVDGPDNAAGIYLDSCENIDSWQYWDSQIGNHTFVATISGNTVSGAYYGLEIYGTLFFAAPADEEALYTYVNDIVVENNYVNDSWYGMYLYDAMTVRNNNVECDIGDEIYGIYWYEAEGQLVDNTITAEIGVYVDYLHHWLVQGNLIQFGATGMYIYTYDDEEDADGMIVDNTITALENPFLPGSSYGIEVYETGNVLISGNVISGADYNVYLDDVWNITVEGNEISDSYSSGVYVYDAQFVWVESNTITDCNNGVYISSDVEDLVIGNNTFIANYYGIYLWEEEVHRMVLWNNIFIDNEYGVEIDSDLYMEVLWYVDAQCQASRSDIYFDGPIYVLAGGSMVLEDMEAEVEGGFTVDEGGLLSLSNVYVDECWNIDVAGTFWATLSVFEETDIYVGPGAMAEIRTSAFYDSSLVIEGSAPSITDNLFVGFGYDYGIVVLNGAAPVIVSNIIAGYTVGIYANGMDMGGIYDNLIVANSNAGLLTENCTGGIHDNIFLLNRVEILLRNSDVSVEDNEIGYTDLFQVIANYAPILGQLTLLTGSTEEETSETSSDPLAALDAILAPSGFSIEMLGTWLKAHNGIWAESSTVRTSGNLYGLLNYALYAVDSDVTFTDDVRTIELIIPQSNEGETYNYSLNVYTLNGIFAARSTVHVSDCTIEVLDDALMLEASQAWIEGVTLMAGDFDYFIYGGSEVYNIGSTYSKAKVEDSHSLNEGTRLTLYAVDKGDPAVNVTITIRNAKGDIVFTGVTDADGKVEALLIQYAITSMGKDDGFNPYTINATFESGEKSMELTLNQSYQEATIVGEEESDFGALLAVIGVLVIILLIVAAVVIMRRRK